jgi:hypothetical protein
MHALGVAVPLPDSAVAEAEGIRAVMEDQFLTPGEVEEAALKCAWLAHYWVRHAESTDWHSR